MPRGKQTSRTRRSRAGGRRGVQRHRISRNPAADHEFDLEYRPRRPRALAGRSGAQAFRCPPPGATAGMPNLPWTSWNSYPERTAANGQEYALIGGPVRPGQRGNLSHVLGTLHVIVSPEGRVVTVITH